MILEVEIKRIKRPALSSRVSKRSLRFVPVEHRRERERERKRESGEAASGVNTPKH